jgi:TonB family protein
VTALTLVVLASLAQAPSPSPSAPVPPLRAGAEIKEPRRVKEVRPDYPEEAYRAGLGGVVILECVIDPKGSINDTKVLRGVPPLTDAAQKAVRKWRYTPTLLNGVAVPVIMTVTVNFKGSGVLDVRDLRRSLKSPNEFVRESAAGWLSMARSGRDFDANEFAAVVRELQALRDGDASEQVRAAAARSLAQIEKN